MIKIPDALKDRVNLLLKGREKTPAEMSVSEYRELLKSYQKNYEKDFPEVSAEEQLVQGIRVRIYCKNKLKQANTPGIIYIFGGAFIEGTLDSQDGHCRAISQLTNTRVIAMEYRLAPEHCFPAGFLDVYAVTKWIFENSSLLKLDKHKISICGFSSGGNYAALVANKLSKESDLRLYKQILISPCLDLSRSCDSHQELSEGVLLDQADLDVFFKLYLGDKQELQDPCLSPLFESELTNLPSTIIYTAKYCPFRDENKQYAEKLLQNGIKVKLIERDALHVDFLFAVDQPLNSDNPIYLICS